LQIGRSADIYHMPNSWRGLLLTPMQRIRIFKYMSHIMNDLSNKYSTPAPRYTSYPTVPFWDTGSFSGQAWKKAFRNRIQEMNGRPISIYIHLPFCESMCTFCGCFKRITKRHDLEGPYIDAILKEFDLYRQQAGRNLTIAELHLGGGTPTFFSPDNLARLIEGILSRSDKAGDAEFSFEGHPQSTSTEHLHRLKELGFERVCFGVQDYNPRVQEAIHRIQPFQQVMEVSETARRVGYTSVAHDLIYGLPFQTEADVAHTVEKTIEIRPDRIAFYSYAHVPWRKGNGQRGFKDSDLPGPELKLRQQQLGKNLLLEAGYMEIGMDHFALIHDPLYLSKASDSLHRNFMGYTPRKTELLLGLGVSSISDSSDCFAQNVKSIEEYQHLVGEGVLPVVNGHVLSEEDIAIREMVESLMCNFWLEWGRDFIQHPQYRQMLEEWRSFEQEGLLYLGEQNLEVLTEGKPFVRNICMVLDQYLRKTKPEEPVFSLSV